MGVTKRRARKIIDSVKREPGGAEKVIAIEAEFKLARANKVRDIVSRQKRSRVKISQPRHKQTKSYLRPTAAQIAKLAEFDLTAKSRGHAADLLRTLALNNWQPLGEDMLSKDASPLRSFRLNNNGLGGQCD
jgi:hypothetical protein